MDNSYLIEILAHIANIAYIAGFAIKKMHFLRVLMIIGAVLEICYFLLVADTPLWSSIFWCIIWIAVNGYQLVLYYIDKLNFKLTNEESRIYQMNFHPLSISDFKKLLKLAKWKEIKANEVIVEENTDINFLYLIFTGVAVVESQNKTFAYIRDGNFIGEISLLSGGNTTASVSSLSEMKIIEWNREELKKLLEKNKDLEEGLKTVFNLDFVKKLSAKS